MNSFSLQTRLYSGQGSLDVLKRFTNKHIWIICDGFLARSPLIEKLRNALPADNRRIITTTFDIGFNSMFILDLNSSIEKIIMEFCLALELALNDVSKYFTDLDNFERQKIQTDLLHHMRNVISNQSNYMMDDLAEDETIPFRVWIENKR
jgi:hypothetical protein